MRRIHNLIILIAFIALGVVNAFGEDLYDDPTLSRPVKHSLKRCALHRESLLKDFEYLGSPTLKDNQYYFDDSMHFQQFREELNSSGCTPEDVGLSKTAILEQSRHGNYKKLEILKQALTQEGRNTGSHREKILRASETFARSVDDPIEIELVKRKTDEFNEQKKLKDMENNRSMKASCNGSQTIDQRALLPPNRDQGRKGWCARFAAADLISFKYRDKPPASGLDVSYQFNRKEIFSGKKTPLDFDSGNIKDALLAAGAYGVCSEKDLPSSQIEALRVNDELEAAYQALMKLASKIKTTTMYGSSVPEVCGQDAAFLKTYFPTISPTTFESLARIFDANSVIDLMLEMACKRRTKDPGLDEAHIVDMRYFSYQASEMMQKMQEQIASGNIVGISWNPGLICDSPGSHSSSIVGRRWKDNKCQFLIRNSWGETCTMYKAEFRKNCERGNVWVDSDTMTEMLDGITYIQ